MIALGFHVDYWNQLGWNDSFSQKAFSDRQRRHSTRRGVSFVVTPQFLLNGQDYRGWGWFDDIESKVAAVNKSKPLADIRVALKRDAAELSARIEVSASAAQSRAEVFAALIENNLTSSITAGENKGATLKHD